MRFEATHVDTTSFDRSTNTLSFKAGGDYFDALPSASLRFAVDKDSDLRLVYGRGLSRPNPSDITKAVGKPVTNQNPNTVSVGNPNLKAEHANNYDILYERSFNNAGLLQAGYFYKDLSRPDHHRDQAWLPALLIIPTPTRRERRPSSPSRATRAARMCRASNSATSNGLTYLPGVLRGAGISANYSYTNSQANGIPDRSDSPALLRDAPNSWNISPTFDTKRFSMRVGMTFDDAMIYQYNWTDGADLSGGVQGTVWAITTSTPISSSIPRRAISCRWASRCTPTGST